jgi:hypothetical protein
MLTSVDRDSIKIALILDQFELEGIKCRYCRVDINRKSLDETVRQLDEKYTHVECSGLHGTFEDGLAMAAAQAGKKVIISLGSTVINFDNSQALENLRGSCRDNNMVIIGHQGPEAMTGPNYKEVHRASYHTKEYEEFMLQGALGTGNEVLGEEVFKAGEWTLGCAITPNGPWSHEFIFHHQGKEIFRAFSSKKFNEQEVSSMFKAVGAPSPAIHRHSETAMSKAFKPTHLQDINKWQGFTSWIARETKRVWMGHGGALNLLEGKFHCEYTKVLADAGHGRARPLLATGRCASLTCA